jgi:glutamate-1-semialdehyde 2,1-aminomutase
LPRDGYLEFLREITAGHESLLLFDEVMTGFRLGLAGAQGRFGITPDLSCFGKVIGGGLPVGAFGGRAEIMDCLAPDGPVYQAGTLSGNPLAMAAGVAVLEALADGSVYEKIEALGQELSDGLAKAAAAAGVSVQLQRIGSMSCCYFADAPVHNMAEAMKSDRDRFAKYFHGMLEEGVYFAPSQFEAGFISAAHDEAAIEKTVAAATKVMKTI